MTTKNLFVLLTSSFALVYLVALFSILCILTEPEGSKSASEPEQNRIETITPDTYQKKLDKMMDRDDLCKYRDKQ